MGFEWKTSGGIILILVLCCTVGQSVNGELFYVDSSGLADFDNIQAAIDNARDGDAVIVHDGRYTGPGNRAIDFNGKAVTLQSANGPTRCIIDCEDADRAFHFHSGELPDTVVDGFTITRANHEYGAIFCETWEGSSPTINNCIIVNNRGKYAGGIRSIWHSEPVITNCIIMNNHSENQGGGIRCSGGHLYNCVIAHNNADQGAGIMNTSVYGLMTITNCTIVGNEMWIHNRITPPMIFNSIVWDSNPEGDNYAGIRVSAAPSPYILNSNIQGGWHGSGNIDADPMFIDPDGADDIPGTQDDNLRLLGVSPCLNTGLNGAMPYPYDLDANPRVVNGYVDMGAYEGPHQGFIVSTRSLDIPEGDLATFTVTLAMDPLVQVTVGAIVESDDPDITIESGANLTFDSSNYAQPQTVTLTAAEDNDFANGMAVVTISADGFHPITIRAAESENDKVLYVDTDAQGAGTGFSWTDSFTSLSDALSAARQQTHVNEIRVARGIYRPDQGADQTSGDRLASFELVNDVSLMGGYAGWGQPDPDKRDPAEYETILTGDLNGDDVHVADPADLLKEPTRAENSYHVVKGFDFVDCHHQITAVVNGFTITGGNANAQSEWGDELSRGGGLYSAYVRGPIIINCVITANSARWNGGGVWGGNGTMVDCLVTHNTAYAGGGLGNCHGPIVNCTISDNFAERGGGIVMYDSDARIENCTIIDNIAEISGGGIYNENGSPILSNCTVSGNSARSGAGMYNRVYDDYDTPRLLNCNFVSNSAQQDGGGMYNDYCAPYLRNCVFDNNSARHGGGIVNYYGTELTLSCCTFARNSALKGDALACKAYNSDYPFASRVLLTNCILWDGDDEIWDDSGSIVTAVYCNVQGGWEGTGNINIDPIFAGPDAGDFHLKSQSGRWEPNSQSWINDDVTSLCIDAGNPANPIGREAFPNGGIVNMGAYGGTAEASKSYFGGPICETIVAGDVNGDCRVDLADLSFLAFHWLENNNP
jgi:hypothetical protein